MNSQAAQAKGKPSCKACTVMHSRGTPKLLTAPVLTGVAGLVAVGVGSAVTGFGSVVAAFTGLVSVVTGVAWVVGAGSTLQAMSNPLNHSCTTAHDASKALQAGMAFMRACRVLLCSI